MRTEGDVNAIGGLHAVTIDCRHPLALARFWARVFGTEIEPTEGDAPQYVDLLPVSGVPTPILRLRG
jgi:hypothetical protein